MVDRQIAKVGSQAFAKAWRKNNPTGKVVLLTPHYDILDWIDPDWVIDTKTKTFERGRRRQRPQLELKIFKTDWRYWNLFKQHHYLKFSNMPASKVYVGTIDGELVCHIGVAPAFNTNSYRAARFVVMPEWQGIGVGKKFLNWVGQYHLDGNGASHKMLPLGIVTSHTRLCQSLVRDKKWKLIHQGLCGRNGLKDSGKRGRKIRKIPPKAQKYITLGSNMRSTMSFKYVGE